MVDKILFVDDDQNVLHAYQRQLRKQFNMDTALGGEEGLNKIRSYPNYAIVISDMRMPGMDGIEFLRLVQQISPLSVRIMLTGFAELKTTIDVVNKSNIFRFLTKPCSTELLIKTLEAGIKQYKLMTAEKELLEQTLKGSINVLTEILALVNPEAFGRASRIKKLAQNIAIKLNLSDVWKIETAAMLSHIGCIILPENTLKKLYVGEKLTDSEYKLFYKHPQIAADLLAHIPRLNEIREFVACQEYRYDGSGKFQKPIKGKEIPIGARILKVVLDFDMLEAAGYAKSPALARMEEMSGWYDPDILSILKELVESETMLEIKEIYLKDLQEDMTFAEDVNVIDGPLIVSKGQEVGPVIIQRIKNFTQFSVIREPIKVMVPIK